MNIHSTNPLDPVGGAETPRAAALDRRTWLRRAGWGLGIGFVTLAGYTGWKRLQGSDEEVLAHGRVGMRRRYEAADEAPAAIIGPRSLDRKEGRQGPARVGQQQLRQFPSAPLAGAPQGVR